MKRNIFKSLFHQSDDVTNRHDDAFEQMDTDSVNPEKGWGKAAKAETPQKRSAVAKASTGTTKTRSVAVGSTGTAKAKTTAKAAALPKAKSASATKSKTTAKPAAAKTKSASTVKSKAAAKTTHTAKAASKRCAAEKIKEPVNMNMQEEMLITISEISGRVDNVNCEVDGRSKDKAGDK